MDGSKRREDILEVAARLFTSRGFDATTTRQIAQEVGLRQGSLFYYFPRKDDILAALLNRTVEPALDFAKQLESVNAEPACALYLLSLRDSLNIFSDPHQLAKLQLLPNARRPEFKGFWSKRQTLKDAYRQLITLGQQGEYFRLEDDGLLTDYVFGMVESPIMWFNPASHDPRRVAEQTATAVISFLLTDDPAIKEVRDEVSVLLDQHVFLCRSFGEAYSSLPMSG